MKYKHGATPGEYHFIDDAGNKSASFNAKNKPGMIAEMQAWVDEGNEIEAFETPEEIAEKQAAEDQKALDNQPSECIRLLNESDAKVNGSYPNSDADKQKWEVYRAELREIMGSDVLRAIPEKPF